MSSGDKLREKLGTANVLRRSSAATESFVLFYCVTIRYEMPFDVRSKAGVQLNLPHGNDN